MYIIVILILLIAALIICPILITKAQKRGRSQVGRKIDDWLERQVQQKEVPKYYVNTSDLLVDERHKNVLYMDDAAYGGHRLFAGDGASRVVDKLNDNRWSDANKSPYEYRPTFPLGLVNLCSLDEFLTGKVEIYSFLSNGRVTEITRAISLYEGMVSVRWDAKTVNYRTEN